MKEFIAYYQQLVKKGQKQFLGFALVILAFAVIVGLNSQLFPALLIGFILLGVITLLHWHYSKRSYKKLEILKIDFPEASKRYLEDHSLFYRNLSEEDRRIFDKRVQFFLAEKRIVGVDTEIEENVPLLVAASAIIPTFAFPYFEYPNIHEIVLYADTFDENFQASKAQSPAFSGMVGNRFLNNMMVLSQKDLIAGFNGTPNMHNVGIHEFVHLLDKADGATDGIPEIFMNNAYTLPWMQVVKEEIKKIKTGRSDINPYGLTNNAEFLAVASEYFFDNPNKFQEKHPELYTLLCTVFHQKMDKM
jgi:Mlc titration factor MtfA (ptsG expression regulator)